MRFAWAMLVATGCRGILGIEDPQLVADGASDGPIDAPAECATWHPHFFDPCAIPAPGRPLVLDAAGSPYTFVTTSGTLQDRTGKTIAATVARVALAAGGGDAMVLDLESLTVQASAELDVVGALPFIVASWDDVTIPGVIDAGSHHLSRVGAGANAAACTGVGAGVSGDDALSSGGSGGGGGGALRGSGGDATAGDNGQASGGIGGAAIVMPATLVGGCGGGASGSAGAAAVPPATAATRSDGGAGGGALLLAARTTVDIPSTGAILAGGAGGSGATTGSACGGGGGGSGGMIALDAPQVMNLGIVAANGGGGGGSAPFANSGNAGFDGLASATPAGGGPPFGGGNCGLGGGPGGAGTIVAGASGTGADTCGGGGGGGGAGFVIVWASAFTNSAGTISPSEILNPP